MRAIHRERLGHLITHRLPVIHLTAQAVLIYILPAPAQLLSILTLIEPLVGNVYLACLGEVAEAILIHIVRLGIHRAVSQNHSRKTLVGSHRNSRREVNLGAKFAIEVEVHKQALLIGRLAVLHIDLTRDSLVTSRYRSHTL